MGADGHWLLMKREDWDAQYPDLDPNECELGTSTVLGVPAVCKYWDTDGKGDSLYTPLYEVVCRYEQSLKTARENAGKVTRYYKPKHAVGNGTPVGSVGVFGSQAREYKIDMDALGAEIAEKKATREYGRSKLFCEAVAWFKANAEDHEVWT